MYLRTRKKQVAREELTKLRVAVGDVPMVNLDCGTVTNLNRDYACPARSLLRYMEVR